MNSKTITGQQKYENYREQFKRLNKALANGFNLEAMFIEYAILEDRTESILRHAGLWEAYLKKQRSGFPTIDSKIKYIIKHAENKKAIMHKYFSDDLLDEIINWKNQRNRLIHALLKQQLVHNEVNELAQRGNELVKMMRNRASSCNRRYDKDQERTQNS